MNELLHLRFLINVIITRVWIFNYCLPLHTHFYNRITGTGFVRETNLRYNLLKKLHLSKNKMKAHLQYLYKNTVNVRPSAKSGGAHFLEM